LSSNGEGQADSGGNDDEDQTHGGAAPALIEWVLAGVSAVLLFGVIGLFLFEALTNDGGGPVLFVKAEAAEDTGAGFRVPFTVQNTGDMTAAAVVVEATIVPPGQPEERAEATLDYVPAQSETNGGFFFEADPRGLDLQVRVLGYQEP